MLAKRASRAHDLWFQNIASGWIICNNNQPKDATMLTQEKTSATHQLLCERIQEWHEEREKQIRRARPNAIKKSYLQKSKPGKNGRRKASTKACAPKSADSPAQHTTATNKSSPISSEVSSRPAAKIQWCRRVRQPCIQGSFIITMTSLSTLSPKSVAKSKKPSKNTTPSDRTKTLAD